MNDKQIKTIKSLCAKYNVDFHPEDFRKNKEGWYLGYIKEHNINPDIFPNKYYLFVTIDQNGKLV